MSAARELSAPLALPRKALPPLSLEECARRLVRRAAPAGVGDEEVARAGARLAASAAEVASAQGAGKAAAVLLAAAANLRRRAGDFPDETGLALLLAGRGGAGELLALAGRPEDPRAVVRGRLAEVLAEHGGVWADPAPAPRAFAGRVVRELEAACYRAALGAAAAEHVRRAWNSPGFVSTYSARCGTLLGLALAGGTPARVYGDCLVGRLASGELDPAEAGGLSAAALCPAALAAAHAEIEARRAQRVEVKAVNHFACTFCGARRATYREVRRRAGDEATVFECQCLDCGRAFTGHN